jgi:hypothetical protein
MCTSFFLYGGENWIWQESVILEIMVSHECLVVWTLQPVSDVVGIFLDPLGYFRHTYIDIQGKRCSYGRITNQILKINYRESSSGF